MKKTSMKNSTTSRGHAKLTSRFVAAMLVATLAVGGVSTAAFATPAEEKQAEAQAVLAELNSMQEALDAASNAYFEAEAAQQEAQSKMDDAQKQIEEYGKLIKENQEKLGVRAKNMYRTGATSFLDMLLGAASFKEFSTTWEILEQMNASDAALVQESKDLRTEVEKQKAIYVEEKKVADEKAAECMRAKDEAEQTVANMQAIYSNLSAEAEELLAQERAAEEAAQQAAAQQVIDNASSGGGGWSEPEYNAATGNAVVDRGLSYVGKAEYVWGGCAPGQFDCSGFVSYCLTGSYSRLGTTYTFLGWPQVSDPQPGDVAVNSGHCGIYIGGGQMVHSATYGVGVVVGPVQSGMTFHRW